MIAVLTLARWLMVLWIIYALIMLFAPHYLHQQPHDVSASIQAIGAFAAGYLMDRAVGMLRRRRAARESAGLEP
jgi:competence protein ComGC